MDLPAFYSTASRCEVYRLYLYSAAPRVRLRGETPTDTRNSQHQLPQAQLSHLRVLHLRAEYTASL